jgi:hypothetical protein
VVKRRLPAEKQRRNGQGAQQNQSGNGESSIEVVAGGKGTL